jgi:hypothetical protein
VYRIAKTLRKCVIFRVQRNWHVLCNERTDTPQRGWLKVQEVPMFKLDSIIRSVATIACTIVFSAACVLSAVGPAHTTAAAAPNSVVSPLA